MALRAAMIWAPKCQPEGIKSFLNWSPPLPGGWQSIHHVAINTEVGGCIETHHKVLLLLPQLVAENLRPFPRQGQSPSTPFEPYLNDDKDWTHDALTLGDLDVQKPSESQ
jgi:hypothetical protein